VRGFLKPRLSLASHHHKKEGRLKMELKKEDYYVFALAFLCILLTIHNMTITSSYNDLLSYIKSEVHIVPKDNTFPTFYDSPFLDLTNININITDEEIENVNG